MSPCHFEVMSRDVPSDVDCSRGAAAAAVTVCLLLASPWRLIVPTFGASAIASMGCGGDDIGGTVGSSITCAFVYGNPAAPMGAGPRCLGFLAGVAAVSRPRSSATATMQLYFRRSGSSRDTVLQNQVERRVRTACRRPPDPRCS